MYDFGTDCDDTDANVHPDADQDGDGYYACIEG